MCTLQSLMYLQVCLQLKAVEMISIDGGKGGRVTPDNAGSGHLLDLPPPLPTQPPLVHPPKRKGGNRILSPLQFDRQTNMSHEKVGCVSFCKTTNDFHSLSSYASSYSCDLFSLTKVTQETLSHLFSLWRIFVSLSTFSCSLINSTLIDKFVNPYF